VIVGLLIANANPPPWLPCGFAREHALAPDSGRLIDLVRRLRPSAETVLAAAKDALHWAAGRTGLPVVVVAALALVVGWRVARRTWHIAFELALALAVLLVATRLGWIRW
jgi:hypothetical protein